MPYIDLQTSNDATRWLVSVYFATLTVTTIGYGEGFFFNYLKNKNKNPKL